MPLEDEILPAEEQPLSVAASPTADSPGYVPESDLEEELEADDNEDLEEDPADYPLDQDDDEEEEEPSGDERLVRHGGRGRGEGGESTRFGRLYPHGNQTRELQYHLGEVRYDLAVRDLGGERVSLLRRRPIRGRRADYRFVDTVDAKISRRRAEEVGYGIRDAWVDPRDAAEERLEDTQGRQTQIYQRVKTLVDDSQYHYETARLLDQEALVSREAWGRSMEVSYMARSEIMALRSIVMSQQTVISQLQAADCRSQTEQLVQTLTLMQSLQGHVTALQGQQGPSGGPAQPVAPEEAGSSS
ncbi:hypothetical protein Tco_0298792 [Tanacetum coccineum]